MRLRNAFLLLGLVNSGCNLILGNHDAPYVATDGGSLSNDGALSDKVTPEGGLVDSSAPCTEAGLASDPRNCGGCGHDCRGGSCTNGVCGAFTLTPAPSGTWLAVDDTNVYWTMQSLGGGGSVWMCSKSSCAGPHPLTAPSSETPSRIATRGTAVYWTSPMSVWGCDRDCCAQATKLGSGSAPTDVATDDAGVYWVDNPSRTIYASSPVGPCGTDAGVTTATLATDNSNTPYALAVAGGVVYWDGVLGAVSALPPGVSTPLALAMVPSAGYIAATPQSVYVTRGPSTGFEQLYVVPSGGGSYQAIVTPSQTQPSGITLDMKAVFFTSGPDVWMLALAGGAPALFAQDPGPANLLGIAVDDVAVYWLSAGGAVWEQVK